MSQICRKRLKNNKAYDWGAVLSIFPKRELWHWIFSIFNDGLVADTRSSTDDSELFLKEVFNWGSKEFGIQLPAAITRQYLSEFNFELDHPLSSINPKLAAIGKKLGEKIGDENIDAYEFSGISFGKQWTGSGMRPQVPFRIERANNSLAKDNRFWTSAPLRTNDHMNLVDGIVALLKR